MNLLDLRNEVLAHEVNSSVDRINGFLNSALRSIARKVDYYADEAEQAITTVAAQAAYPWPADFGRARYLRDTDPATPRTLQAVRLRQIDEAAVRTGRPYVYAVDGPAILLYPTPDTAYTLSMRYWSLPALMVSDTDVPALPDDFHSILPYYALQQCYATEDDMEMSQFWGQQFAQGLRDMAVDVKFPSTDSARRVKDMWGEDDSIAVSGWGPW